MRGRQSVELSLYGWSEVSLDSSTKSSATIWSRNLNLRDAAATALKVRVIFLRMRIHNFADCHVERTDGA
jgi:hypothetical protein